MNLPPHPIAATDVAISFGNAHVVLADRVIHGFVVIAGDRILDVGTGPTPAGSLDLGGDYLLPGLVDIHTDHFEKHVFPRAHVRWNIMRALLAHDAQVIGGGITTVFDSLCVGATATLERREILAPMLEAIEAAQAKGMLRAEHLVHLRCEITDALTPELTAANIDRPVVRLVSVMEHVPGLRQSRDLTAYIDRRQKETGKSADVLRAEMDQAIADAGDIGARVRPRVVDLAHQRALPLMSHDDTEVAHIELAKADGVAVSEFPCTLEAARAARAAGMAIVAGAPNLLRGGSQSGNVAVADLLAEGLVDVLASDYVPRSLLDCAFALAEEPRFGIDLPRAVAMVAKAPAGIAGVDDRGEIAPGKRADLLHVALADGHPCLKQVWRAGRRVS
ncbi:alpha-D-ribose 1-methylphosphonate 5-triphosphate diphosphatase [Chelatococcus asaccharovorans]|uniref:Alpha-D-ribose 1-methylphosphonate 5-triphosphate diphosphatase n=1 Tax=Chelatococcus asaccharovorans TaxID=28210 RepID=A0A2V3TZG5_9HYPH|nr:alpha-D-ribose 1-methylphosphonate 5-triphosphate diphosphatase [Chelatococcus asaccharovorans]MBS7707705.1 alpha-D-ribose 1-methylphosphonate 5-triphosphate diphosphatase [Chelatococcus asaccharovorans]PXW55281.1 alpha-D-ribose 1-methylphosphonate 5-triphosphate diphosphatase [Chelatococcus asaccharovorans]